MQNFFGKPDGSMLRDACGNVVRKIPRLLASLLIASALVTPGFTPTVEAAGQTRTLKLYFVHTGEKAQITFKRNGRYDPKGLQQINQFLRDWRRNEPTRMDPRLLDLVWEVYQKSGSHEYIHVVSAYRSPATNGMLRSRTKGVAKKSQHMLGKAMDFYLPDVKLATLREIGMKFQVGGVGYYPTSGSPFVHMDVGGVRAWPRMSRNELVRLFPDGRTMHLPADGGPLPGYEAAVADYKRRVGADAIQVAGGGSTATGEKDVKRRATLFAMLFGGGDEDEEPTAIASADEGGEAPAPARSRGKPAAAPAQPVLAGVETGEEAPAAAAPAAQKPLAVANAPVPAVRPGLAALPGGAVETALVAPPRNAAAEALAAATPQPNPEFADLSTYKIPVPQTRVVPEAVAAIDPALAEETELAFVPVPALRPAGQDALTSLAAAEVGEQQKVAEQQAQPEQPQLTEVAAADPDAQEDAAEPAQMVIPSPRALAANPHPAVAQAETRIAMAVPTPSASQRPAQATAKPANARDALQAPVEMAAYQPAKATRPDAFAVLEPQPEAPVKGKRPKKEQAESHAPAAKRTEPKLTEKIIAEWALSNSRMATLSEPVKAPRFVSKALRASPTTVYSAGFSAEPQKPVDTARFSGSAVNFLEVKKFSTN
ncbi:ATP/GTP-binding protein [Rhizobium rhizosphaerae]|uniref:Murein endopeptidase K n=1 Tax=Xaviernesmea rhizosphaerae TaxID=1672749 RepID=A0A1Q9AF23_9HYPH|nr:ATP/GTP-binding protein [Xaviernesmea rhizosphaerae]